MNFDINQLIDVIDRDKILIIQAHDYPDHDAIASGFGLKLLLEEKGIISSFMHRGIIESYSLETAINRYNIPIYHIEEDSDLLKKDENIKEKYQIILVDSFVGNKNVSELNGEVICVIDHHVILQDREVKFKKVCDNIGSCSTIMYFFYKQANIEISKEVASAFLMGIMVDTAFLTRGVSKYDIEAYSSLYFKAENSYISFLLKNTLSISYLINFKEALNYCEIEDDFCFIPIESKDITPEFLAIIADFFLSLKEINFVVALGKHQDRYRLSIRSDSSRYHASTIIKKAIKGIGYGGGHIHMGGGTIPIALFPGVISLKDRFLSAFKEIKENS